MSKVDSESLRNQYQKRVEYTYNTAKQNITDILKYYTREYSKQLNFHVSLNDILSIQKEYQKEEKALQASLKRIEVLYQAAQKLMDNDDVPENELEELILQIKKENIKIIPNGKVYSKIFKWKKENGPANYEKEFKDDKSRINNISSLFISRLKESYKLYRKIQELNKYNYIKDINRTLPYAIDFDEKLSTVKECEAYIKEVDDSLERAKKLLDETSSLLATYDGEKFSEETADLLEKTIVQIITEEYLDILNDPAKFDSKVSEYITKKEDFLRNESKYTKHKKEFIITLLKEIGTNFGILQVLNAENSLETQMLPELSTETEVSKLINFNNEIIEEIKTKKIMLLEKYYHYIIYFYSANDILDKMSTKAYETYIKYQENPNNIDECLEIMKKIYYRCYYSVEYDLEITVTNKEEQARENLIKNIKKIIKTYEEILHIELSETIKNKCEHIDELDIKLLYNLYMSIITYGGYIFDGGKQKKI